MQDRNKKQVASTLGTLARTVWNLAVADGLSLIIIAVFIILLGRLYGSAPLGKFSFALAVASIGQTLCIAGYDISLPRAISKDHKGAAEHCRQTLRVQFVLALLVLPLCFMASWVKDSETILCTALLCIDVIPTATAFGFVSALRGLDHASEAARYNAAGNILPMMLCGILVWFAVPLWVFAVCILAGDILKVKMLARRFAYHSGARIQLKELLNVHSTLHSGALKRAWDEQRAISLTSFFSVVVVRMPNVMLGWFATDVQNGIYAAAARFFTALRIVPGAILHTVIPRYAQSSNELPRIRAVLGISILCAAAMSAILYFGAPMIINLSFRFHDSVAILQILSFAFFALFIKTTVEAFLLAAHQERFINSSLIVVGLLSTILYWLAAKDSAQSIAWVLCGAESCLALVFISYFVVLRWRRFRSGTEKTS